MSAGASGYLTGEEKEWCGADYDTFGMYNTDDQVYELFPDSLDSLENDMVQLLIPTPQLSWWGSRMEVGARFTYPDSLAGVAIIYDPSYLSLVSVPLTEGAVEILEGPSSTDYGTVFRTRWEVAYEDPVHWIHARGEDDVEYLHTDGSGVVVYPPGSP